MPKCGYHTVYYTFKPDGTPILHQEQLSSDSGAETPDPFTFDYDTTEIIRQHQIKIRSASGTPISITAKDVNTPRKNLGHFKSPSRCTKEQTTQILIKASNLASTMTACQLTRNDAAMIYHTVFRPSIEYTLGQSFLTASQLLQI